jgi:hypothetical protein
MDFTVHTTNTFLSLFNEIDSLFIRVLWLDTHMPFHEKLHALVYGSYSLSPCVRKFHQKLRYFGDMRNQIVHGFHQDHHHYMLVSEYACQQISYIHHELHNPKPILEVFWDSVLVTSPFLRLGELLGYHYHTPQKVIALRSPGGWFTGVITSVMIAALLAYLYTEQWTVLDTLRSSDALVWVLCQRAWLISETRWVAPELTVYELEAMLLRQDAPWVVVVTERGCRGNVPIAALTVQDLPKLMPYVQLW